ncbi:MAG: VanZ family protein [Desulforhopalus sp.]|nr:VanZ family protein [Desulforhopalus sp.]
MSRTLIAGLRTIPMALVMGIIFFLSAQPGDTLYLPPFPGIDKLAHLAAYGVLAASVLFAFSSGFRESKPSTVFSFTVVFCLGYGISDEVHQVFVPGRSPSGFDIFADACGALLVCGLWLGWKRNRQARTAPAVKEMRAVL